MNKLHILIAFVFAAMAGINPCPAQQTKQLTASKHNEYGLVYSLPTTALRFIVTAEKQTLIAGPYANYAKKYLGASNPILESGEKWVIKDVSARTYGIADQENQYLMQLKPGATTYIEVANDGMLLSINHDAFYGNEMLDAYRNDADSQIYSGKEYLQYVDEDFIASQSKAKQAEMLAENLMEVRDAYLSLTRGTAETMPVDGQQLQLMLSSLKEQERAMTAAFIGCSYTETITREYTFIPDEEGKTTLFRFSDFKGFCAPDDYAGAPVDIKVTITSEGKIPVDANGKEKELPKDAVRYVIPGTAEVDLRFNGKSLWSDETNFAQYGIIFGLNPSLFTDKKEPSYATFDPATGAVRKIGVIKE